MNKHEIDNQKFHRKNVLHNIISSLNYLRRAEAAQFASGETKLNAETLLNIKAAKHLLKNFGG